MCQPMQRRLREECYEAYNIQVQGLAQRLATTGIQHAVLGVSGGLDSTQALIVSARAMDLLGRPRSDVLAYTLPGFATSDATRANAKALIGALGVTGGEIDIRPAARQMLADLGHPFARGEPVYDVTFENVQAGLRTDYLFRIANQRGGLVVGTGDLSELGLGWCTYGVGDHMSHYNVNASVPKTLIQHLIRFVAASGDVSPKTADVLHAVLATEISPELVPAEAAATIQSTQQVVGPYALQDFNLFYLTRHGFRPSRIAYLAERAWGDVARGSWPTGIPDRDRRAYSRGEILALAAGFPHALLRQPVQALDAAEWPENLLRWLAVAARRLARAIRCGRACVARGTRRRVANGRIARQTYLMRELRSSRSKNGRWVASSFMRARAGAKPINSRLGLHRNQTLNGRLADRLVAIFANRPTKQIASISCICALRLK